MQGRAGISSGRSNYVRTATVGPFHRITSVCSIIHEPRLSAPRLFSSSNGVDGSRVALLFCLSLSFLFVFYLADIFSFFPSFFSSLTWKVHSIIIVDLRWLASKSM